MATGKRQKVPRSLIMFKNFSCLIVGAFFVFLLAASTTSDSSDEYVNFKRSEENNSQGNSNSNSDAGAFGSGAAGAGTGAKAIGVSGSSSESQSFSDTKVKTRVSSSSNARSNSSAASKVKTFAKTSTSTKVKTGSNNSKSGADTPKSTPPPGESMTTNAEETTTIEVTRPFQPYWGPEKTTTKDNYIKTTVPPGKTTGPGNSTDTNNENGPNGNSSNNNCGSSSCVPYPVVVCVPCPVLCPYASVGSCPCQCPVVSTPTSTPFCAAECPATVPEPVPVVAYEPAPAPVYIYDTPECNVYNNYCKREIVNSKESTDATNEQPTQYDIFNRKKLFKKAAVAADHHLCSTIGKGIFLKGGNSIDAAIATHFCVEVVNSHSTGLGGGGFLLHFDPVKNESFSIDFREQLPLNYNPNDNLTQGDTILVPGVLKGFYETHKRRGKLPWKQLFEPAIKLARKGFRIHDMLAMAIEKKASYILTNLGLRELFAPNGYTLRKGMLLKRVKLANTYQKIADSGSDEIFYKGEIAHEIIKDISDAGGNMTLDDLRNYQAIIREPLDTEIAGMRFLSVNAPASGPTVALMLKLMERFNWSKDDLKNNPGKFYHQMIEAMKFAYAPTTFLGDPRFFHKTDQVVSDYMLNEKVIDSMFKKIDSVSHSFDYYGPYSTVNVTQGRNGTSHISVLGPDGDACSLTTSINAYFGSKILSRRLGFIYNNEISDFSDFWPEVYKYSKDTKLPGKRPISKVAPIILVDKNNQVNLVAGAAGGFFIPTCLASVLSNYLFLKDNITVAVSRPRIHCQLFPPTVVIEDTFPKSLPILLKSFSHQHVTNDTYSVSGQAHAIMGVVQAISRHDDGKLEAVCDYRKGGLPDGY